MFSVEIHLIDLDKETLTSKMTAMREWLDRCGFEPSTFHYTFTCPGISFTAEFKLETEAAAFAREFSGRVVPSFAGTPAY